MVVHVGPVTAPEDEQLAGVVREPVIVSPVEIVMDILKKPLVGLVQDREK